jgi:GDP-L-fucose synthase
MLQSSKIFIASHLGLVGSALTRKLREKGFTNLVERSRKELDLTNQHAVEVFFANEKPEYVLLAAAKIGGIHANNTYPA